MNLPNKLTLLRIILVPVMIALYALAAPSVTGFPDMLSIAAAAVFILAALTDIADGKIARRREMITVFGKFIDPIADKLLVVSALILLTEKGLIPGIIVIVIVAREFIVSGIRLLAASNGSVITSIPSSKLKTIITDIAIVCLMLDNYPFRLLDIPMTDILVYISLALTVWSGAELFIRNAKTLKDIIRDAK